MDLLVYGASGQAKVVIDILRQNEFQIQGLLDDNKSLWGSQFQGYKIYGLEELSFDPMVLAGGGPSPIQIVLAIGDNSTRKKIANKVTNQQDLIFSKVNIIHPVAQIDDSINIGDGTVIMANVVVNVDAEIGKHVILNTACTVDHDCIIEDYVHLSPGVHLAGNVHVGEGAHLGVGVSVIPGIKIGAWSVIGAGAAVVDHIPAYSTAVGVPARVIKTHKPI